MTYDTATLVLGGARSGKSSYALSLAVAHASGAGSPPGIIATAQALDAEMETRIARHKQERGHEWLCAEEPIDLPAAFDALAPQCGCIVVDCLTLWLSNIMHAKRNIEQDTQALVNAVAHAPCPVVLVSNEVGLGLVPETALGREFRDAQGRLNQALAAICGHVSFIAAGLPMHLKGAPSR